jgi:hypothetical protein
MFWELLDVNLVLLVPLQKLLDHLNVTIVLQVPSLVLKLLVAVLVVQVVLLLWLLLLVQRVQWVNIPTKLDLLIVPVVLLVTMHLKQAPPPVRCVILESIPVLLQLPVSHVLLVNSLVLQVLVHVRIALPVLMLASVDLPSVAIVM